MPDDKPETVEDSRAVLMEGIWRNADARPYLEEAIAKTYPKASVPGREARLAEHRIITEVDKRLAAAKKDGDDERARQALLGAHARLGEQGFTPEDIKEIEKIMVDEGVGTHQNAATLYQHRRQIATPRSISTRAEMPGKSTTWASYFTGIKDDPDQWARVKTDQILTDFANGKGQRWLDESYWPAHPTAAAS